MVDRCALAPTEPHPAAQDALQFVAGLGLPRLMTYLEAFSSCAIENNRLGEICGETLRRVLAHEPVSDRYILGLAWELKRMEDQVEAE